MPRSLRLASHTASSLSVLGRPGRCLTSRALTSHTVRPRASSRYNQARQESEVDSTTTRWIPWQASCSASSMIVLVVAGTCHTLVMRRPGLAGCGTRVHTIPDALATSIAATRATSSSGSSTSTMSLSTVSPSWATSLPPAILGIGSGLPGSPVGTGTLTGVLKATVRDPAVGPRRQTESRPPTTKHASASPGNPPRFSRPHGVPAGDTSTETKIARVATGSAAPRLAELGRACPILIPRGGPRPWGSYQRWTAERCANAHLCRSRRSVSATGWGEPAVPLLPVPPAEGPGEGPGMAPSPGGPAYLGRGVEVRPAVDVGVAEFGWAVGQRMRRGDRRPVDQRLPVGVDRRADRRVARVDPYHRPVAAGGRRELVVVDQLAVERSGRAPGVADRPAVQRREAADRATRSDVRVARYPLHPPGVGGGRPERVKVAVVDQVQVGAVGRDRHRRVVGPVAGLGGVDRG